MPGSNFRHFFWKLSGNLFVFGEISGKFPLVARKGINVVIPPIHEHSSPMPGMGRKVFMGKLADQLVEAWGCPMVARSKVSEFSGGLLNSGTLANLHRIGAGPTRILRLRRKLFYLAEDLAAWIEKEAKIEKPQEGTSNER